MCLSRKCLTILNISDLDWVIRHSSGVILPNEQASWEAARSILPASRSARCSLAPESTPGISICALWVRLYIKQQQKNKHDGLILKNFNCPGHKIYNLGIKSLFRKLIADNLDVSSSWGVKKFIRALSFWYLHKPKAASELLCSPPKALSFLRRCSGGQNRVSIKLTSANNVRRN